MYKKRNIYVYISESFTCAKKLNKKRGQLYLAKLWIEFNWFNYDLKS